MMAREFEWVDRAEAKEILLTNNHELVTIYNEDDLEEKVDGLGGLYPFLATKVTVLAVLFIFLNLAIKSYKNARHNIVVNENKHLALKTFEIIASHTQDEKTRDIVLVTANNLIYSDINTGYLSQDSNSSYQENVLEEMIKNFNKK